MPILQWLNRNESIAAAGKAAYRILEEDAQHAYGEDSPNILVHGDNLEALKALLPYYAGQVKCIYIDPPYNTRSAFEHYDDNLEHSTWLQMMYPRLELLRDLLREDGSIWVSIDDNEAHYLKVIMDEVFGRKNFVADVAWQKRTSPANDAKYFSNDYDNLLVYAKSKSSWQLNRLERTEAQDAYYKNPDNDPRGPWNSITYTGNKTKGERPNLYYGIVNPNTEHMIYPPETLTWRYGQETHAYNVQNNLLYWGKNGQSNAPRLKMFLRDAENVVPRSVWMASYAGSTQQSMTEQKILFANPFGTPKPELLLSRILNISSNPGDLVLDSFLGSGTTAAVAHKMGRRWIGVEIGDHAVTHCVPRLQKVVDGEQGGISNAVNWHGGGGFRFFRLGETVFDEMGQINPAIRFPALAAHIWFSETGEPYRGKADSPLLGVHAGTAYYLLFNGILGDKRPAGGNVLTTKVLTELPAFDGPKVIFGEAARIGAPRMAELGISFRQTPYDIKAR